MSPHLPNGIYDALCRASHSRTGISALDLVRARYRNSRQEATKCRTFYARHLRRAARMGLLRQVGTTVANSRFYLTEAGRAAAIAEAKRRRDVHGRDGTFPRLESVEERREVFKDSHPGRYRAHKSRRGRTTEGGTFPRLAE